MDNLPRPFNLFAQWPEAAADEDFHTLLNQPGVRIERIVSQGHASPPDFWYDQAHDEWVVLVQGEAVLEFAEGACPLKAGDSLLITAHRKHRVAFTGPQTVWLAVHLCPPVCG